MTCPKPLGWRCAVRDPDRQASLSILLPFGRNLTLTPCANTHLGPISRSPAQLYTPIRMYLIVQPPCLTGSCRFSKVTLVRFLAANSPGVGFIRSRSIHRRSAVAKLPSPVGECFARQLSFDPDAKVPTKWSGNGKAQQNLHHGNRRDTSQHLKIGPFQHSIGR